MLITDFKVKATIAIITKNGQIKKTNLNEFSVQRYSKPIKCMKLSNDDEVVDVGYLDGDSEIVVLTESGNALRYHEENVSLVGIRASGIKAINDVKKSGKIIGASILHHEENKNIVIVTNKGAIKVINPKNINLTNRTNKVTPIYRCFKSDPHSIVFVGDINSDEKFL